MVSSVQDLPDTSLFTHQKDAQINPQVNPTVDMIIVCSMESRDRSRKGMGQNCRQCHDTKLDRLN